MLSNRSCFVVQPFLASLALLEAVSFSVSMGLFYVNPRCLKLSQISDGVCKLLKNIVLRVKHFLSSFKSFHLKFLIAVWLQEAPVYDCAVTTSLS